MLLLQSCVIRGKNGYAPVIVKAMASLNYSGNVFKFRETLDEFN